MSFYSLVMIGSKNKKKNTGELLIDCTFIGENWEPFNSLTIYAARLIQGFLEYGASHIIVLLWEDNEELFDSLVGRGYEKIVLKREDLSFNWRPLYRLFGYIPSKLRKELKKYNIPVVLHPFHYDVMFVFPRPIRQFAIMHDHFLLDRVRNQRGKVSYYIWHKYQKMLLWKFTHLISISRKTHDEMLLLEGVDSSIVYNSVPFDFNIQEQPVDLVKDTPYILDVNRFQIYKNPQTLVRALYLIKDKIPHSLYLKGDKDAEGVRDMLRNLANELGLQDRVIIDDTIRTEGEMRYLYSHADLFVSPSQKEGFGWTPIEAAILKTPVLVSDIDVFNEVLCGRIPKFNPESPEDLASHIMEILNNPMSELEKTERADFFLEKYSLKKQVEHLEKIMDI